MVLFSALILYYAPMQIEKRMISSIFDCNYFPQCGKSPASRIVILFQQKKNSGPLMKEELVQSVLFLRHFLLPGRFHDDGIDSKNGKGLDWEKRKIKAQAIDRRRRRQSSFY